MIPDFIFIRNLSKDLMKRKCEELERMIEDDIMVDIVKNVMNKTGYLPDYKPEEKEIF